MTIAGPKLWFGGAFLLALIVVAQLAIGWHRLLEPWTAIAPSKLMLGMAFTLLSYAVRSVRVYDYFLPATRGSLNACFKLTLLHNFFNNLLPMRAGETSFPVLMRRYFGTSLTRALAALLWFRLMDLHALAAVAIVAAGSYWWGVQVAFFLIVPWVGLAWGLFHLQSALPFLARSRFVSSEWHRRLLTAHGGLPQTAIAFWRAWCWTLLNWAVKLLVFAWVLQLFAPIPAAAAIIGAIGGDLTSVLPVHGIAGAGTYEAGVVAALLPFKVPAATALAAAINLHLFMLGMSLIGGVLAILIRRDGVIQS